MQITSDTLVKIMHCSLAVADVFIDAFNATLEKYDISTSLRLAHFLAQVGHESGSLHYVEEIASGVAYEGRKDLGNVRAGDGKRFKGRGLIQITGRANYQKYGDEIGIDFIANPQLLASPLYAVDSAGWFWNGHGLNTLADVDDLTHITRRINGGTNGINDRQHRLIVAKQVLGI